MRREHVHLLRVAAALDEPHAEGAGLPLGQHPNRTEVVKRVEQTYQHGLCLQRSQLRVAWRAQRGEQLGAAALDLSISLPVGGFGKPPMFAEPSLDKHLEAKFDQLFSYGRDERYPGFRRRFL